MSKAKRGYTNLNVSTLRGNGENEFTIVHTVPMDGINNFSDAVENWRARTKEFTAQSLCDYINSKSSMTGHIAITKEDAVSKYGLKL